MSSTRRQTAPTDVHIGQRIRERRMTLRISQEKLGDALGLTFQQVQKYEKGTNRVSAAILQKIAGILSAPIIWFYEGSPGATDLTSGTEIVFDHGSAFLSTRDGVAIAEAWPLIEPGARKRLLDLIRALAGVDELGIYTKRAVKTDSDGPRVIP